MNTGQGISGCKKRLWLDTTEDTYSKMDHRIHNGITYINLDILDTTFFKDYLSAEFHDSIFSAEFFIPNQCCSAVLECSFYSKDILNFRPF